jgi:site-specific recombinase XerD
VIIGLADGTLKTYIKTIRKFLNALKKDPNDITESMTKKYLGELFRKNIKLKASSLRNYYIALKWYLTKIMDKEDFKITLAKIKK